MTAEQEIELGHLMTLAQDGNRQAYEDLLTRVSNLVLAFVRRRVGDAPWAEDVMQECLVALGESVGRADFSLEAVLLIVRWAPVMAGVACVPWAAGELAVASATGAPTGRLTFAWHCVYKTASVAAVPGIALFAMVRQAAPLRAAWAGLLAVLATAAVGVLGANVICPVDRPLHLLLWHVAPLILFAALGAALGTWLLRWTPLRRAALLVPPSSSPCPALFVWHATISNVAVNRWNVALDGKFSEAGLRAKLELLGYRVARYVYSPGTVFPDHKHGVDRVDAVVAGRFRLIIGGHVAILGPGEWVSVPSGVIHSAVVMGDEPVIALDAVKPDSFGSAA